MKKFFNFFTRKKEVVDDTKKDFVFKITLEECDFNVHTLEEINKDSYDQKEKTLLLIALHQLKETILHDNYPNSKEES